MLARIFPKKGIVIYLCFLERGKERREGEEGGRERKEGEGGREGGKEGREGEERRGREREGPFQGYEIVVDSLPHNNMLLWPY